MKNAVLRGSTPGVRQMRRKSPSVIRCGRHSSPLLCSPPNSSVSPFESGVTVASIPTDRNAAAISRAPA